MKLTTIGIDVAKNVLQVHGADSKGKAVLKKQLVILRADTNFDVQALIT